MKPNATSLLQTVLDSRFLVGSEIPSTGAPLEAALDETLSSLAPSDSKNKATVDVKIVSPPNVNLIAANLSGFNLKLSEQGAGASQRVSSDVLGVADRLPAVLDKLMIKAHPLIVEGVPVEFDLQVEKIPFDWITDKERQVWVGPNSADTGDMSGEFTATILKDALQRAVLQSAQAAAARQGMQILDLDLDIRQAGSVFTINANARVRKSIIKAQVTGRAQATYDPSTFQFRVDKVDVSSHNAAVAMLLKMVQSQIAQFEGKTVDLNELLAGSGKQLTQARVDVSPTEVRVTGRFS